MTDEAMSPLRRRMIEDMSIQRLHLATRKICSDNRSQLSVPRAASRAIVGFEQKQACSCCEQSSRRYACAE